MKFLFRSIILQTQECSDPCHNPFFVNVKGRNICKQDLVCGVARCAQVALSGQSLLDRTGLEHAFALHAFVFLLLAVRGLQPHDRQFGVEFLGLGFNEVALLEVLTCTLQLDSVDITALLGFLADFLGFHLVIEKLKLEFD